MYQSILVPIDGSDLSTRALQAAIELAGLSKGKLRLLHVVPPFQATVYMGDLLPASEHVYIDAAKTNGQKFLAAAARLAEQAGLPNETQLVVGEQPSSAIVHAAREHQADLIVMGSHGWRGITRLLLGSETQKVLLESPVPVLVSR